MPRGILTQKLFLLKSGLIIEKKIAIDAKKEARYRRLLALGLIIFGMMYIWQINVLATRGFEVTELEQQKSELVRVNDELEMRITEARSTESITQRLQELEMVPVYNVSYIDTGKSGVAVVK